jgi:polysaccharide biosynthesis/export protein
MKVFPMLTSLNSRRRLFNLSLVSFSVCAVVFAFAVSGRGQEPSANVSQPAVASMKAVTEDTRYRIGPGDVLTIIVSKAPELSMEEVRVDQRGMITIPMITGGVQAACKTEIELSQDISTLYLIYKRNPSVSVFVKDFQSQPVAVIGAVDKPGQFRLQRQVRLLEVISHAGGPTDKAGRVINVIHPAVPNLCSPRAGEPLAADLKGLSIFKLNDTLNGVDGSNPFIMPGDVISLPEADLVFVVGYVYQPRSIPLKDKTITVSRAVAMAGGPQRDASTSSVRIVRQNGDVKQEIPVDLKAIQKLKAEDVVLLPNDIVQVGSSTSKTLLGILTGAMPSMISNGAIRVIP